MDKPDVERCILRSINLAKTDTKTILNFNFLMPNKIRQTFKKILLIRIVSLVSLRCLLILADCDKADYNTIERICCTYWQLPLNNYLNAVKIDFPSFLIIVKPPIWQSSNTS